MHVKAVWGDISRKKMLVFHRIFLIPYLWSVFRLSLCTTETKLLSPVFSHLKRPTKLIWHFYSIFLQSYSHFIGYHIWLSCKLTAASPSPSMYVSVFLQNSEQVTTVCLSYKYNYLMSLKLKFTMSSLYQKLFYIHVYFIWVRVYCFYNSII